MDILKINKRARVLKSWEDPAILENILSPNNYRTNNLSDGSNWLSTIYSSEFRWFLWSINVRDKVFFRQKKKRKNTALKSVKISDKAFTSCKYIVFNRLKFFSKTFYLSFFNKWKYGGFLSSCLNDLYIIAYKNIWIKLWWVKLYVYILNNIS